MKILLINSNRFKQPWPVVPFGLCCVAASLEKANHSVEVLDLCFSKNCRKDIKKAIDYFNPDIIGISIRNIDIGSCFNSIFLLDNTKKEVVAHCKEFFQAPIVIGGPAVGISGPEMLDFFDLEYAVCGDGEVAMVEFANRIERKSPLEGLHGLIIRKNGKIIQEPSPFMVSDLDTLPIPRVNKYIDVQKYARFDSPIQIQAKRGCALRCLYCVYNKIEGRDYRFRSPNIIADEIEILVKETGINHIEFTDSAFNVPIDHAKNVLKAIIRKKLNLRLRTLGLNPGAVDEELVDLMKEAGFEEVDLSAESLCDETLKGLGKNYVKSDVIRAGRLLSEKNIFITWYFLLGAPNETEQSLKETINSAVDTAFGRDLINFCIGIRLYKGSPLADEAYKENPSITKDNFLHLVRLEPDKISLQEIRQHVKRLSFRYANIYVNDEDETTPAFVLMLGTKLFKIFGIKRPVWTWFIILRKIETALGIRAVKKWVWERKNKKFPKPLLKREAGQAQVR
ncbi:MAG: radical SAM protein [Candidatus Omnitrophota bacterium]